MKLLDDATRLRKKDKAAMTALEDKLAKIAELVPEFRRECAPHWDNSTNALTCASCHGLGYIHKPAYELVDVLWKAGWDVWLMYEHWKATTPEQTITVTAFPPVGRVKRAEGANPYETLADAVLMAL